MLFRADIGIIFMSLLISLSISEPIDILAIKNNDITNYAYEIDKQNKMLIDDSKIEYGVILVSKDETNKDSIKYKIGVSKNNTTYYYDFIKPVEILSLQLGNGNYEIVIYKNVSGNKYTKLITKNVELKLNNELEVFLLPNQSIYYNYDMEVIKVASELTNGLTTDYEKVQAIYNYVTDNYNYDKIKVNSIKSGYIPNIDDIYANKKGICYDYASLTAAMLRSVGIPTKLVTGYSRFTDVYHAWNEVYVENEWKIIDTTFDAGSNKTNMFKDKSNYTIKYFY